MIPLLLVFALHQEPIKESLGPTEAPQQVREQEQTNRPRPTTYIWRDRAGRRYVTPFAPPANATIIEVVSHQHDEAEAEPAEMEILPTPGEIRAEMESVFDKKTIIYWHDIETTLLEARLAGNNSEQIQTVDALIDDALWGKGLWVMPLLPLMVLAIFILLAWWTCSGISKPGKLSVKTLTWALFVFVGIVLSHVVMQYALYFPQAKRMDFLLAMLPNYFGGHIEAKPDNLLIIQDHARALLDATSPMVPPWAFPMEVGNTKATLNRVVVDP